MKTSIFLALCFCITVQAAELLPIDIIEEMEGSAPTSYTEFWQIEIADNSAKCIAVKPQQVPGQNYAEAYIFDSDAFQWLTKDTAKIEFPTSTGKRTLLVTIQTLGNTRHIKNIEGNSISTSMLSDKIIKKTFKKSSKPSHTIKIDLPPF